MSYRRRRGLGRSDSWLDRLREWLSDRASAGDGGEPAPEETGSSGSTGDGDGPGPDPGRRVLPSGAGDWRRVLAAAAILASLFGAGYLVSAEWLFPASPETTTGELVEVPDLVGLGDGEARQALEAAGLAYRQRSGMPHREAPEGAVLAQSPLPGQYARPGAPVAVTLSLGPEERSVPDLRGLSDRQGRIVLERLGFDTGVDTTASPVERGRVVGTRPEADTRLTLPAEVTVLVSEGPQVSDVPDLTGLHVDDVRARLESAGLELGEVEYDPEAYAAPGRVVGQSPPAGYALRTGGRVSIRVAGAPPAGGFEPADSAAGGAGGTTGPSPDRGRR